MGAPGWLSRLYSQLLILAQVMISPFVTLSPALGFALNRVEPAWDSLPLSLPLHYPRMLSLSLKINKLKKKKKITMYVTELWIPLVPLSDMAYLTPVK